MANETVNTPAPQASEGGVDLTPIYQAQAQAKALRVIGIILTIIIVVGVKVAIRAMLR